MHYARSLFHLGEALLALGCILYLSPYNRLLTQVWRFAEMFAGQANVSQSLRFASYSGVSFDVEYGGRAMDLLTPSGMAFLSYMFWKTFALYEANHDKLSSCLFPKIFSHFQSEGTKTETCFPFT